MSPRPQGELTVERICMLAGVSRAGYYRHWAGSEPRAEETAVRDAVQRVAIANRRYGYRRIAAQLRRDGLLVNRKRVLRLMRQDNLLCLRTRPFVPKTTDSDHGWCVVPNLTRRMVLTGLDQLPPSLNFWRHLLQWIGGLGVIIMALAVMPLLGVGGMQLYKGQAPGVKDERLAPRITETAKNLWTVYALITAAGIVSLRLCGMSWFDAICHAFSAVGLGGFSTHDRSIAYFGSAAVEGVLIVLMAIASLNFSGGVSLFWPSVRRTIAVGGTPRSSVRTLRTPAPRRDWSPLASTFLSFSRAGAISVGLSISASGRAVFETR